MLELDWLNGALEQSYIGGLFVKEEGKAKILVSS